TEGDAAEDQAKDQKRNGAPRRAARLARRQHRGGLNVPGQQGKIRGTAARTYPETAAGLQSGSVQHHVAELLDVRRTVARFIAERSIDRPGQVRRSLRAQFLDLGKGEGRKLLRITSGQRVVQGRPQRVEVAARIDVALVLLGRREAE